MYSFTSSLEASRPFLTWQRVVDWAQAHYRDRSFHKDEPIPARPGLLYLVEKGAVRMLGSANISSGESHSTEVAKSSDLVENIEDTFLGFVGAGQPFEIVSQPPFTVQANAHIDETSIIWLYWHELDNWPHFRREVFEAFRYKHQRKLLWLSTLGQRRTIDRLLGFITLLIEEYGEPTENGYCLPYSLTHAQIGSAIGSTRVTVTRLMGKLRQAGLIAVGDDNLIYLPNVNLNQKKSSTSTVLK
ncbi:MAG: Crp/Fnr family transcriptional regulator [Cyanobacteria bacterium J083]|nr:MAG: Crp/Fnr family transcriptional regulator [Cyanobacteria bacterium J083]